MPSILETYRRGDYRELLKSETFLARYDRLFAELGMDAPTIVELGVYDGGSLRLWSDALPRARIIGFDLKAPAVAFPPNCSVVTGNQAERADLERLAAAAGTIDIVIDDCSHIAEPTRLSFDVLFPHLRPGGLYVIEDWGTGYWPSWPGGALMTTPQHTAGMVGLVKSFVDDIGTPARHRLRQPPSIHEANWSTQNSPFEYVTYFPGIVCIKKAQPPGEPMHSPLDRKQPSIGPQMIDAG